MPSAANALTLAVLALATAGIAGRGLVPRVGDALARRMLGATSMLPAVPLEAETADEDGAPAAVNASASKSATAELQGGPPPGRAPVASSLDIPAERVARLTARQLRGLRATDVLDATGHAIGARLSGVGALGLGLADGDVVMGIDGRSTPGAADATGAAMASYASGEPAARATVLRAGVAIHVTVHIPPH